MQGKKRVREEGREEKELKEGGKDVKKDGKERRERKMQRRSKG